MQAAFKEAAPTKEDVKNLLGYDLPFVIDAIIAKSIPRKQIEELRITLYFMKENGHNPMYASEASEVFKQSKEVAALFVDSKYTKYFVDIVKATGYDAEPALLLLKNERIRSKFITNPNKIVVAMETVQNGIDPSEARKYTNTTKEGKVMGDQQWEIFISIPESKQKIDAFLGYCDEKISKDEFLKIVNNESKLPEKYLRPTK